MPSNLNKQQPMFWNGNRDILTVYVSWLFAQEGLDQESNLQTFWRHNFKNDLQPFLASVRGQRPICINPSVDVAYVDFNECLHKSPHVADLYKQDPTCIDSIRTLEIRNGYWFSKTAKNEAPSEFKAERGGALKYFRVL
jgi:homospermidine synthase